MRSIRNSKAALYGIYAILSFIAAYSAQYIMASEETAGFYGMHIFSFGVGSAVFFALTFFLISRFDLSARKIVFSSVGGMLLSGAFVWGRLILTEGSITLGRTGLGGSFAVIIGLSVFTIPLFSELIKLADTLRDRVKEGECRDKISVKYFLTVLLIFFVSYIPFFLRSWPINMFGDASDEIRDYLLHTISTHHSMLHTLMLGWAYDLGVRLGDPARGMMFFTLFQMLILSGSMAFFMSEVHRRGTATALRKVLFFIILLNPVNAYFAVTAEKGTIGLAVALIVITLILRISDGSARKYEYIVLVLAAPLACHFRNNLIYAYLAAGIIFCLLRKGAKKKLMMIVMLAAVFLLYKGEKKIIMNATDATSPDTYREAFVLPEMCLARTLTLHGPAGDGTMPEDFYDAVTYYIPEYALEYYSPALSNDFKFHVNETGLRNDKVTFIKLFIKGFFKYPGDYIDQFCWLTFGYWNPGPTWVLPTTLTIAYPDTPEEFDDIIVRNLWPIKGDVLNYIFYGEGKFEIPVLGLFARPFLYIWICYFAVIYGAYKKDKRLLALAALPFMYLLTVYLGPTCLFRYMHFNILTMPVLIYGIICGKERSSL